jgi:aryl-alcohol dehydrogenase-like predicted oxidoreductase
MLRAHGREQRATLPSSMSNAHTTTLGGSFKFPGTNLTVKRVGYGAMQLAGPHVFGPPKDPDAAVAVLKEAVARGVDHIDTSDYYGPYETNRIIKRALHPYPQDLVIVTKLGAKRGADPLCQRRLRQLPLDIFVLTGGE